MPSAELQIINLKQNTNVLDKIKKIIGKLGKQKTAGFNRIETIAPSKDVMRFIKSCIRIMQNLMMLLN